MDKIALDYKRELEDSPDKRDEVLQKLLTSKVPFPPYKIIDLNDLKHNG